jgi:hypothetical protein
MPRPLGTGDWLAIKALVPSDARPEPLSGPGRSCQPLGYADFEDPIASISRSSRSRDVACPQLNYFNQLKHFYRRERRLLPRRHFDRNPRATSTSPYFLPCAFRVSTFILDDVAISMVFRDH